MESTPYMLLHQLVDEAPADGGVVDRVGAANALSALGMTKGARLMLSTPPAIISVGLAGLDRARGRAHGIQPRSAQAVDRGAGHLDRQARQQARHVRDVAVVLAGLVGAAEETSVTACQSTLGLRAISALSGIAPRSSVRTEDSAPP